MIALAIAIGLTMVVADGAVAEGSFLALLVFVLLGAIFPPVAIPLGVVVLVALFWRGAVGPKVLDWLGSLGATKATTPPTTPALGPQAYLPNSRPQVS